MMNRQAQAWGLKNTPFKNVTGLTEPGHQQQRARHRGRSPRTSSSDFPSTIPYYSIKEYTYNNITQDNRNLLLRRDPTVDGMKTGYTEAAGYCLVATAQREFPNLGPADGAASAACSASCSNTDVDRGARQREPEAAELGLPGLRRGAAVRRRQADGDDAGLEGQRQGGQARRRRARCSSACRKGEGGKLQTKIERTDPLVAPLAKGQRVGTIKVTTPAGTPVAEVPLVVLERGRAGRHLRPRLGCDPLWIK